VPTDLVAAVTVIPAARVSANPSAIAAPANRTGWRLAKSYQASHPRLLTAQPFGRVGRVLRAIRRTRALCLNLFAHSAGYPFRKRNIIRTASPLV